MKSSTDKLIAHRSFLESQIKLIDDALSLIGGTIPKVSGNIKTKERRGRRKWTAAEKLAASKRAKERWAKNK